MALTSQEAEASARVKSLHSDAATRKERAEKRRAQQEDAEFASTEDADQAFLKQGQVLMSRPVRLDWAEDKPKKWEQ